jgi:hypothetical protein
MSKSKPAKQPARSMLQAQSLLGLLFNPEDGGSMFLQNIDKLLLDYTASHPRRQQYSSLWIQMLLHANSFKKLWRAETEGLALTMPKSNRSFVFVLYKVQLCPPVCGETLQVYINSY